MFKKRSTAKELYLLKKIKNVLYYVGEEITDLLLGAPGCGPPIGLIIALSIVAMIVFAILK